MSIEQRPFTETEHSLIDFCRWLRQGQEIYASEESVSDSDVIGEYNRDAARHPDWYKSLPMEDGLKFLPWILDGEVVEWEEWGGRALIRFDEWDKNLIEQLVCVQYPRDMAEANASALA